MTPVARRGRLEGDLEALSVVELAQTLNLGGKTACVSVQSDAGAGTMWFVDGVMTHATAGQLFGELAVYALVEWTTGRFVVDDGLTTECKSIVGDTPQLLLEGLRRVDEKPPGAAPVSLGLIGAPAGAAGAWGLTERGRFFGITACAAILGAVVGAAAYRVRPAPSPNAIATLVVAHDPSGPRVMGRDSDGETRQSVSRARPKEGTVAAKKAPVARRDESAGAAEPR